MPYVAGWNMPGYLPETEPEEFDTFAEAVTYLVDTVDRFWDQDTDALESKQDAETRWVDVHTALHNASPARDDGTSTFAETCGDGHLHFWITPREA